MADENEVDRLARECREDASRINAEFWRANVGDYARRCTRPLCLSAGSGWSAEIPVGELAALARVIANLPAIAGQFEAARATQAADAERVREVVRAEAYSVIHRGTLASFDVSQLADTIADRATSQLAGDTPTHDLTAGMLTGAGRRIAELEAAVARMAPVVAAADAWLYDPCKGLGSHSLGSRSEHDLEAAVRAYSATAPAPGS